MKESENRKEVEINPITPEEIKINGVEVISHYHFNDSRGCLTVSYDDDREVYPSVYSYVSTTKPGMARDEDQYHFHKRQIDRFTVVSGKMYILLFDRREKSSTFGQLQVVKVEGGNLDTDEKINTPAHTITIPEGVYHGVKAIGDVPAVLTNNPTQGYDSEDEGRIDFKDIPAASLNGGIFSWDLVKDNIIK